MGVATNKTDSRFDSRDVLIVNLIVVVVAPFAFWASASLATDAWRTVVVPLLGVREVTVWQMFALRSAIAIVVPKSRPHIHDERTDFAKAIERFALIGLTPVLLAPWVWWVLPWLMLPVVVP